MSLSNTQGQALYKQDVPLMTPQEILALVPAPDVIIYQVVARPTCDRHTVARGFGSVG